METATPGSSRASTLLAFATLYVIWGSTYLAIRIAVTSWPPLVLAAVRFTLAGGGLYAWLRARGAPAPTRRQWGAALIAGTLLLGGGNGLVCWAEQWVPSGETALIVASVPLWMTALPWLVRRAPMPNPLALAGVALGLAGVAVLVGGAARGHAGAAGGALLAGRIALLVASLSWSVGSLLARHLPLPRQPAMVSAAEMLAAGPVLAAGALLKGEWSHFHPGAVTGGGWTALAYLIVFGSLAGFGSYVFLLGRTSAARVSTYAFVNPLVAVMLGTLLAHEPLAGRTLGAAALIVCAVAAVIWGTSAARARH